MQITLYCRVIFRGEVTCSPSSYLPFSNGRLRPLASWPSSWAVCWRYRSSRHPRLLQSTPARGRSVTRGGRNSAVSKHATARGSPTRLYRAKNGGSDRLVILAHGSSASSDEMHVVARSLAENGVTAVAIDVRGHGA